MAETLTLKKRSPARFLGQFTIERRMLSRADRSKGIPSLRAGVDKTGHPVLIKSWAREEPDDEVREIWRNEIRQLHRLAGYPGVSVTLWNCRAPEKMKRASTDLPDFFGPFQSWRTASVIRLGFPDQT